MINYAKDLQEAGILAIVRRVLRETRHAGG
jgi:hypothetical protein